MKTLFWTQDPSVLLKQNSISQIWPSSSMDSNAKLNATSRLIIILTILGYMISQNNRILLTGIITLASIAILFFVQEHKTHSEEKEGFSMCNKKKLDQYEIPVPSNPFMNVMPAEIMENPNRKPAAPDYVPSVEKKINDATKAFIESNFKDKDIGEKLTRDLGDNYNFEQSMRTWYSTANTQIPNDQKGFAEFCYGDMKSCKEDDVLACTKGMPYNWMRS